MTTNYKELLTRLLTAFDSSIDVTEGSPIVSEVVDPFVETLQHDPYAVNLLQTLRSRLEEQADIAAFRGSYIEDVLIKGAGVILEPYRREIQRMQAKNSLRNIDVLEDGDIEDLLANRFVTRDPGSFSTVTIRMWFPAAVDVRLDVENVAQANTGVLFTVPSPVFVSRSLVALQKDGDLYYADVDFRSVAAGDEYSIPKESIISVSGISAVRVTNRFASSRSLHRESNEELIIRAQQGNAQRTLVSSWGILSMLGERFASQVRRFQLIGRSDPEMKRDLVEVVGDYRAEVETWWTSYPLTITTNNRFLRLETDQILATLILPTGVYLSPVALAYQINLAWNAAGGVGSVCEGIQTGIYRGLKFFSASLLEGESSTFRFLSIADALYGDLALHTSGTPLVTTVVGNTFFGTSPSSVTLGGMSGGQLGETTVSTSLHLGAGAYDVFVDGVGEERAVVWDVVEDGDVESMKSTGITTASQNTLDFSAPHGVSKGDILAVYTGSEPGLVRVLSVVTSTQVEVDFAFANSESVWWAKVVRDGLKQSLHAPYRTIGRSSFSATIHSRNLIHSSLDWGVLGAVAGQSLVIHDTDNAGEYVITAVSGTTLQVDRPMLETGTVDVSVREEVEPVMRPFRDITAIERLQLDGTSLGEIPRKDLLRVEVSDQFSNVRNGSIKEGTLTTSIGSSVVVLDSTEGLGDGDILYFRSAYHRIQSIESATDVVVDLVQNVSGSAAYAAGSPSVGKVKMFFSSPTNVIMRTQQSFLSGLTWTQGEGNWFLFERNDGSTLRFAVHGERFLKVPSETVLGGTLRMDRTSANSVTFIGFNANAYGIEVGDRLVRLLDGTKHRITAVTSSSAAVEGTPFGTAFTNELFEVERDNAIGANRDAFVEDGPVFSLEVELHSEGFGDVYNLPVGSPLKAPVFDAEGWSVSTRKPSLTYSLFEESELHLSTYITPLGVPYAEPNRVLLQGASVRVNSLFSPSVVQVQEVLNGAERTVCAHPLARNTFPSYVWIDGTVSRVEYAKRTLAQWIPSIPCGESITLFGVHQQLRRAGSLPQSSLRLWGLWENESRERRLEYHEDTLSLDRRSAWWVWDALSGLV